MKKFLTPILLIVLLSFFGCDPKETINPLVPVNTIGTASAIKSTEITMEGSVSDPVFSDDSQKEKSGSISKFGFVYALTDNPTIENATVVQVGTSIPSSPNTFTRTITGLAPGKAYFIRTFATNLAGTSYSSSSTFTTAAYAILAHVTASGNISGNVSSINSTLLNNNPDAIIITTANWQGGSNYNSAANGVYYSAGQWRMFNQDGSTMPSGVKYNLLVATPGDKAFKHVASASNIAGYTTVLDHPALNNNPNAKLLITQRWNGTYNNSPVGVWYNAGKWYIFNEKPAIGIKSGSEFNVVIDDRITMVEAKPGKISSHMLEIDPAITTAASQLFVTQYYTGVYNPQEVGVWFPSPWSLYNQNLANMPLGAKFFILSL